MNRTVTLSQHGREGQVIYGEGARTITGYQQFGGGDAVAVISMGSADEWRVRHVWAMDRRAQILRYVADELIRQRAPSCTAIIDEISGDIVLRGSTSGSVAGSMRPAASPTSSLTGKTADVSWVYRYRDLRGKMAVIALAVAVVFAAVMWLKTRVLVVEPGKGAPVGSTLRTETHLATLVSQLQPYTPSLHHDPSTERFTLSIFLAPLDGSPPHIVRLVRDLPPGSYGLARMIGSDGRTMWIDVDGLYGVDLRTHALIAAADIIKANRRLDRHSLGDTRGMDIVNGRLQIVTHDRSAAWALDPATLKAEPVAPEHVQRSWSNPPLTRNLAAGVLIPPDTWLGVQSQADLEGAYRPGRWLRAVESANDRPRESRRLMRGEMVASSDDDARLQIRSMAPLSEVEYRNAAFLRMNEKSEPLRVMNPHSVLMLHTSGDGIGTQGTLLVSRVDTSTGRLLWTVDTGIDRFKLEQILPAERNTAFVGPRPPVPDRVSEPLIAVLDHTSGQLTTHSLWQ